VPWLRPAAARRVAALLVGSGLGGLVGAPSLAGATPPPDPVTSAGAVLDTPLPLPGRPLGGRTAGETGGGTTAVDRARGDRSAVLLVRPGDSLWTLAATHLLPRHRTAAPDAAAVDAAWRRLYAANRAAVGPDPDLIHPGTRLDLPAPPSTEGTP
jgi:hypothetical protein